MQQSWLGHKNWKKTLKICFLKSWKNFAVGMDWVNFWIEQLEMNWTSGGNFSYLSNLMSVERKFIFLKL